MTRPCGCPAVPTVVVDAERHAQWHRQIAPLPRADAMTLEAAHGRPSALIRTYIDDEFDRARSRDTFHDQAQAAFRTLARTGRPFTVGHAHDLVTVLPANPSTDWERERKIAERAGVLEWTGEYQDSIVPTSRGSAVKVWIGTARAREGAAA